MLVLTRKLGQRIFVGDEIIIKVLAIIGHRIQLGIEAPVSITINREEVYTRKQIEKIEKIK